MKYKRAQCKALKLIRFFFGTLFETSRSRTEYTISDGYALNPFFRRANTFSGCMSKWGKDNERSFFVKWIHIKLTSFVGEHTQIAC